MRGRILWPLRVGIPFVLLNAFLTLENAWPTLWPRFVPRLSFELCVAMFALMLWAAWRGEPGRYAVRALAAVTTFWILARYLDVTVSAVFGRQVNLYWDSRHVLDLLRMGEVLRWHALVAVVAVVAVPTLLYQLGHRCWSSIARELAWPAPRPAVALIGVAALAIFTAHGIGGRDTRWFFSMPVAPIIAGQVSLLADQLQPDRADAQLSPSPAFDLPITGLHGADVLVLFAESYGVVSLDSPAQAAWLAPHRARFAQALQASGRQVVSTRVRSPTFGGASWLAHAALLTGVDTRDPGNYERLLTLQRPSLVRHFRSKGYRTVNWMPGLQKPWPEGRFYGFDRYADLQGIGYAGLPFGAWQVPDQAAMALLHAQELNELPGRTSRFIVFPTTTSHAPFRPVAPYAPDWERLLRADAYTAAEQSAALAKPVSWLEPVPAYMESLGYTFEWLGHYLEGPAPRDLVTIVIGDHQPLASVTGPGASWDVPVHVISSNAALMKRLESHGFTRGLAPMTPSTIAMQELTPVLLDAFSSPAGEHAGTAE